MANSAGIFDTYGNIYEWTDDVAYGCGLMWQVPINGTNQPVHQFRLSWNIMVGGAYYTNLTGLDAIYLQQEAKGHVSRILAFA